MNARASGRGHGLDRSFISCMVVASRIRSGIPDLASRIGGGCKKCVGPADAELGANYAKKASQGGNEPPPPSS